LLFRWRMAAMDCRETGVHTMTGPQSSIPLDDETIELAIPSIPERTAEVDRLIDQLTVRIGYDETMRGDILIAVNEVVKNAIMHGNKCDASKYVNISCTCNVSVFRIRVCDSGNGFDPNTVPDPLNPENLLKESGRGLLILRTLMDEVRFDISKEGTTVTLVKYGRKR
jgi:serine/threonine-protein kinase RsbW